MENQQVPDSSLDAKSVPAFVGGNPPQINDELLFEQLLRVLDEGQRTGTYKLALLTALINAASLSPEEPTLSTRIIAELLLELYFPQFRKYMTIDGNEYQLRQLTNQNSEFERSISSFVAKVSSAGINTLWRAKQTFPADYEQAVESIEFVFVRNPLPRLQQIGNQNTEFLYSIKWAYDTKLNAIRNLGIDYITWAPGVREKLIVLGPLLRPLIQMYWTRDVSKWSGIQSEDAALADHLFGTDRVQFPAGLRDGLIELQQGKCFYCTSELKAARQVDHFIAWSRWPNDAIENLVVADRCNTYKSDALAAFSHLTRWRNRNLDFRIELEQIASQCNWLSNLDRTLAISENTYDHLNPNTLLWLSKDEFVPASQSFS